MRDLLNFETIWLALALISVVVSIVSLLVVLRNERKRKLRRRLRDILARNARTSPATMEQILADLTSGAIVTDNAEDLVDLQLRAFIIAYISDRKFRPHFHDYLLQRLSFQQPDERTLNAVLRVIDSWQTLDPASIKLDLASLVEVSVSNEADLKKMHRYFLSKRQYVEIKLKFFIEDVKDAILAAYHHQSLPPSRKLLQKRIV